jgi:predicted transporter
MAKALGSFLMLLGILGIVAAVILVLLPPLQYIAPAPNSLPTVAALFLGGLVLLALGVLLRRSN